MKKTLVVTLVFALLLQSSCALAADLNASAASVDNTTDSALDASMEIIEAPAAQVLDSDMDSDLPGETVWGENDYESGHYIDDANFIVDVEEVIEEELPEEDFPSEELPSDTAWEDAETILELQEGADEIQEIESESEPASEFETESESESMSEPESEPESESESEVIIESETEDMTETEPSPRDYYDVTEFGANGSDTADDASAIRKALNKAKNTTIPITIYIPAGTYYIGSTLYIYSNTTLKLDAAATLIRTGGNSMISGRHLASDGTICSVNASCPHGGYTQLQNITIDGGTWNFNDLNETSGSCIVLLRHGSGLTLQNMTVKNNYAHVFNLSASQNVTVRNVAFMNTYAPVAGKWTSSYLSSRSYLEALHLDFANASCEATGYPLDNTAPKNVLVENCSFTNMFSGIGTHHTVSAHAQNITIRGCTFRNIISGSAIRCQSYDNVLIENNVCTPTTTALVYLSRCVGATVRNNSVDQSVGHGVYAENSSGVNILSNTISNTGSNGITLKGITTSLINKNIINYASSAAISVASSTGISVTQNTLYYPKVHTVSTDSASSVTNSGNNTISSYTIYYHKTDTGAANGITTTVAYGVSTATRKAAALGYSKTGYTFAGWKVYREIDDKWYVVNKSGTAAWKKLTNGTLPSGYSFYLYSNGAAVSKNALNGKVHFYATWTARTFTVKYHKSNTAKASSKTSKLTYGSKLKIKKIKKLGFTKKNYKFAGWRIYRTSDKKWYVKNKKGKKTWVKLKKNGKLPSGYTFVLLKNGGTLSKALSKTITSGTVHLYAQWKKK